MKRCLRNVFLFSLAVLSTYSFSFAYKFEGKNVIVDAAANGGSCAIKYGTPVSGNDFVFVKNLNGTNPAIGAITTCSGTALTIDAVRGVKVPRNGTTGDFCFQGGLISYLIAFDNYVSLPSPTTTVFQYRWIGIDTTTDSNSRGFVNVRDFGAKGDGTTNDTFAVKSALAYIASLQGGTLNFPTGDYLLDGNLSLPSGIVIQGASSLHTSNSYQGFKAKTRLKITQGNRSIFRIGECLENIKIRNILLTADLAVNSNTYGIEAVGQLRPGSTTQVIGLDDVSFENFDIGFYEHSTDVNNSWQFDYVKFTHCLFYYNKTAGIFMGSYNSDWDISDSFFYLPAKNTNTGVLADGIRIHYAGNVSIKSTFAGGDSNLLKGGDFINATLVTSLNVLNSGAEKNERALYFGFQPTNGLAVNDRSATVTFISNVFDKIEFFGRATFISTGNKYGADSFKTNGGADSINPDVNVYSTGDRFCYDMEILGCGSSTTVPKFYGGNLVFVSGQPAETGIAGSIPARPTIIGSNLNVNGNTIATGDVRVTDKELTPSVPLLNLSSTNFISKPLLRLGQSNFYFDLSRNSNGYLQFTGNQTAPYRGYSFDGPVKLPTFIFLNLPSYNTSDGEMLYCSDCQKNTAPCSGTGTGALAVRINGQWECK